MSTVDAPVLLSSPLALLLQPVVGLVGVVVDFPFHIAGAVGLADWLSLVALTGAVHLSVGQRAKAHGKQPTANTDRALDRPPTRLSSPVDETR